MSTPEAGPALTLYRYPEELAVVELPAGAGVPSWAVSSSLFSVSATATETTVICAAAGVPARAATLGRYVPFAVAGRLAPELTGILAGLLGPLAEAGVPVFTVSTAPTDWVLVPTPEAEAAAQAWRRSGHTVVPVPASPES